MEEKMDLENIDPMDILAYLSEDLENKVKGSTKANIDATIGAYLTRWDNDESIHAVKEIKIVFPKDLDWFNASKPLSISELSGKLVLLDFFTYCCINCMHVLTELERLEQQYPVEQGLVVIGIHSPKFENEKNSENIILAAQRYGIHHPIVNDSQSRLWRGLGIRCWPTLVLISPSGEPLLLLMGEGHGQFLERFIGQAIIHFRRTNQLKEYSIPALCPTQGDKPASTLCFPSKIARSSSGNFALADTGNHRIIIFTLDGKVLHTIPEEDDTNCAGFVDGNFKVTRFNSPQGVTFLNDDTLFVADTKNHALRQISLTDRLVVTLAGNGEQGNDRIGGKKGTLQALASPWDVEVFRTRDMDMSFHLDEHNVPEKIIVLISMSGTHQIWGYFPDDIILWKFRSFEGQTCCSLVGNGLEENRNNSYPQNAAFAQPSGLAMIKNNLLIIADSESSSVRKVSLLDGKVMAVVGGDRNPLNLFAYGDVDGKQYNAKLQHPLAVAHDHINDSVFVADTYNNKVKQIDYYANNIVQMPIVDKNSQQFTFNEPAGLCFDADGRFLLISNTNSHEIQKVDMEKRCAERLVLNFENISTDISELDSAAIQSSKKLNSGLVKELPLHCYKKLDLHLVIALVDEDLKFTADAPQKWTVNVANTPLCVSEKSGVFTSGKGTITLQRLNDEQTMKNNVLEESFSVSVTLNLCTAKVCMVKRFDLLIKDSESMPTNTMPLNVNGRELITINVDQNISISTD